MTWWGWGVPIALAGAAVGAAFWQTARIDSDVMMHLVRPAAAQPLTFTGAIGYWWAEEGLAAFRQHADTLDAVTVFFYGVAADGAVQRGERIESRVEQEILDLAHTQSVQVWLGVNDFEEAVRTDGILTSQETRRRHNEELLALLDQRGYDGVIIDYEGIRSSNTRHFTDYVIELSHALRARGKGLGVTIPVQRGQDVWFNIDVAAIAPYLDRFELQGYLEFGAETEAGPVASLDWVRALVAEAMRLGLSADTIVLGIAFTSNEWVHGAEEVYAGSATAREALERLADAGTAVHWDAAAQSFTATFADARGREHVVWLEEAQSAQAKIALARQLGLHGVFFWFLSGEDPALWEAT